MNEQEQEEERLKNIFLMFFSIDPDSKVLNLNILGDVARINCLYKKNVKVADIVRILDLKMKGNFIIGMCRRKRSGLPSVKGDPKIICFD